VRQINILHIPRVGYRHRQLLLQQRIIPRQRAKIYLLQVHPQRRRDARLRLDKPDKLEVRQGRDIPPQPVIGQGHVEEHQPPQLGPEAPDVGGRIRRGQLWVLGQADKLLEVDQLGEAVPEGGPHVEVVVEAVEARKGHVHHETGEGVADVAEELADPHGRGLVVEGGAERGQVERRDGPPRHARIGQFRGRVGKVARREEPGELPRGLDRGAVPPQHEGRERVGCGADGREGEERAGPWVGAAEEGGRAVDEAFNDAEDQLDREEEPGGSGTWTW